MVDVLVCIVIYGYNSILDQCLESLRSDRSRKKIVVINNYQYEDLSESEAIESAIKAISGDVLYIQNDSNAGYSGAANKVFKEFYEKDKPEFYLVMNDDVIIEQDVIHKLIPYFKDDKTALIGPKILAGEHRDGPFRYVSIERRLSALALYPLIKLFKRNFFSDLVEDKGKIYRISGCFLFFRGKAFSDMGMMDEHVFLYAEESIIAEKLKMINMKTVYCDSVQVYHKYNLTIDKHYSNSTREKMKIASLLYYYANYRNVNKFRLGTAAFCSGLFINIYLPVLKLIKRSKK